MSQYNLYNLCYVKNKVHSPGQVAQLVGVSFHTPKG